MKKLLILMIYLVVFYCSQAQTTLTVIGTAHDTTNFINPDTLIKIFKKIKPDLILIELDSSFFTRDFNLDTVKYIDILSTNENIAANKYKLNFNIELRPYDITGRNEYYAKTNYFENERKMYSDISSAYDSNKLCKKDREDFELIMYLIGLNSVRYETLEEFNSGVSMKLTEIRQQIVYDKTQSIILNSTMFSKWTDFSKIHKDFWYSRNDKMVENIIKFSIEFRNKKIVVLTGKDHKYYLINSLNLKQSQYDYILKDYWKY